MKRFDSSRVKRYLRMDDGYFLQKLAGKSDARLSDLEERSRLLPTAFFFGLIATILVWILALSFPQTASFIYSGVFNSNLPRYGTLLTVLAVAIPFTPPFVTAFALGNMLWPINQAHDLGSVMSGFNYAQNSNRRWFIVVGAGICGAVNCFLLLVALLIVTGN